MRTLTNFRAEKIDFLSDRSYRVYAVRSIKTLGYIGENPDGKFNYFAFEVIDASDVLSFAEKFIKDMGLTPVSIH